MIGLVVITYQNACMIVNKQYNETEEEWEYKGKKYKAKITLSDNLPFISSGDKVKVYFLEDKEIIEITDIK